MTAETSNARGEWPERYACNGPEGTFWTDDAALANKLIGAAFDRDEWTVTDTQNPTGAATSSTAKPEAQGGGEVAAWETEDGRVISARQKATALRDGGASASSVAPYTTPLYRTAPPSAPVGVDGLIEAAKAAESMLRTVHECASHECEDCREYAGIVAKQLRAALAQQPEARGVVDEGSRIVTSQLLHWGGIPVRVTGTVTTSPGNWSLIDSALTETRNDR